MRRLAVKRLKIVRSFRFVFDEIDSYIIHTKKKEEELICVDIPLSDSLAVECINVQLRN